MFYCTVKMTCINSIIVFYNELIFTVGRYTRYFDITYSIALLDLLYHRYIVYQAKNIYFYLLKKCNNVNLVFMLMYLEFLLYFCVEIIWFS